MEELKGINGTNILGNTPGISRKLGGNIITGTSSLTAIGASYARVIGSESYPAGAESSALINPVNKLDSDTLFLKGWRLKLTGSSSDSGTARGLLNDFDGNNYFLNYTFPGTAWPGVGEIVTLQTGIINKIYPPYSDFYSLQFGRTSGFISGTGIKIIREIDWVIHRQ